MQLDAVVSPGREAAIHAREAEDVVAGVQADNGQALFGYARRLGLSDAEAEDAVQEALIRLWRELGRTVRIEQPAAWTFRTLHRLAMDQHRLRRRVGGLARVLASARTERSEAADRIAVWAEVDRLPERQRHVLYLRYRADLSFDEIATVLDITAGAARSHASRGLDHLRSLFAADRGAQR